MIRRNTPLAILAIILELSIILTDASCIPVSYASTENYTDIEYRTEYRTQLVSENDTVITTEDLARLDIAPVSSWFSQDVTFYGNANVRYYAYDLPEMQPYDNILIRAFIQRPMQYEEANFRFFDMSGNGHIDTPAHLLSSEYAGTEGDVKWNWFVGMTTSSWLDSANTKMNKARLLGGINNARIKDDDYPLAIEFNVDNISRLAIIVTGPLNQWNSSITLNAVWQKYHESYISALHEKQMPVRVPHEVIKQRGVILNKQVPLWQILLNY